MISQWKVATLTTLRADWSIYDGEKDESWSEKHRVIIVCSRLIYEAYYNVCLRDLSSLLQRRSRPTIEAIEWGHQHLGRELGLRFAQPRGDRSMSIDQSEASGYTIVLKSAERHAGSQRSPSAWKKSVSGLPDKKRPNLGKSVLQKETEISSWTSCLRQQMREISMKKHLDVRSTSNRSLDQPSILYIFVHFACFVVKSKYLCFHQTASGSIVHKIFELVMHWDDQSSSPVLYRQSQWTDRQ